jgi:hypothetical protein
VIGQWFRDRFTEAWNAVTSVFGHIGQFLIGLWNKEVTGFQVIGQWFRDRFTEAWNSVTGVFGGIGNWFHTKWTGVVSDFKAVLGGLGQIASGIWTGVTNGVKGGINFLIGLINNVIASVDNIHVNTPFGSIGFNIPKIPLLAEGGVLTRGGLVGMNERGAEVVKLPTGAAVYPHGSVPAGSGSAGGSSIIVNNYVTINAGQANAQETYKLFQKWQARDLRRSGNLVTMSSGGKAAS